MAKNYYYTLQTQVQFDNKEALKRIEGLTGALKKVQKTIKDLEAEKLSLQLPGASNPAREKEINKELTTARKEIKATRDAIKDARVDLSELRKAELDIENLSLRQVNKAMKEAQKWIEANAHKTSSDMIEKTRQTMQMYDQLTARQAELKNGFFNLRKALNDGMKGLTASELERAYDILTKFSKYMAKDNKDFETYQHTIVQLGEEIAKSKGFELLERRMSRGGGNATDAQLKEYIDFYKKLSENAMASAKQVETAQKKIEAAQKILDTRKADKARSEQQGILGQVRSGSFSGTIEETNKAIESLKALKATLDATDADGIKTVDDAIAKLNENLKQTEPLYQRIVKVDDAMASGRGNTMTDSQLNEYVKYYKGIAESATSSAIEVTNANRKIEAAQKILTEKKNYDIKTKGVSLLNEIAPDNGTPARTTTRTIDETKAAIEQLKQYKALLDTTDENGIERVNGAIAKLNDELTKTEPLYARVQNTWAALSMGETANLTDAQLNEYIKFYKGVAEAATSSATEVENANKEIAKAQAVIAERKNDERTALMQSVMTDSFRGTVEETKKAIEQLNEYKKTLGSMDADGIKTVDDAIDKLNKRLEATTPLMQRIKAVDDSLGRGEVADLSNAQLKEYVKYYKDIAESATSTASQIQEANGKIAEAQGVLDLREYANGLRTAKAVMEGTFTGTVNNAKEAIEQLQKMRGLINLDNRDGIKRVDEAIAALKEKISATNEAMINGQENVVKYVNGNLNLAEMNTTELEKLKKDLLEYQKALNSNDTWGLENTAKLISEIDKQQVKLNADAYDYRKMIEGDNIKEYSLNELKAAYEALQKELASMAETQEDYNEKAAQLRIIDRQVKKLNESMHSHATIIENAVTKLRNYVLVYMSFNKAKEIFTQSWDDLKNLSDQMTNVQKVTNLAAEEVASMTNQLQTLDTRISTTQLMELAEQAGKMGIAAQGGAQAITEFVKAGQMITSTLGEDIGGAEAVSKILKVNDLVNDASEGIEQDMNRIGSAILNIGNNSKASYADIVEFTTRMGAVGSVAKLSMTDIMALGGTFSALGGNMESSSTAMTRILMAMQTKTDAIAKAAHIATSDMRQMMNEGQSMEALYEVLMHIKEDGAEGIENLLTAVGGRNNAQAKSAVALLTDNIDRLRTQMVLAEEGYADGTLAIQEYEKANDNLAGTMARVTHEMGEMTINSNWVQIWNYPAKALLAFTQTIKNSSIAFGALIVAAYSLTVAMTKSAMSIGAVKAGITSLGTSIKNSGTLIVRLAALMGNLTSTMWRGQAGIEATKKSWLGFSKALKANALGIAIAALAAIVHYITKIGETAKKSTEQIADMKGELESETQDLYYLAGRLKDVNVETEKRQQYINEFNSKFGQYLHNMLSEASTLDEIAAAASRAEAAINKKTAASLRSQGTSKALENNQEDLNSVVSKLRGSIKRIQGLSNSQKEDITRTILGTITAEISANKGMVESDNDYDKLEDAIVTKIKSQVKKEYGPTIANILETNSRGIFGSSTIAYARDYAKVQRSVQQQKNEYEWVAEGYETSGTRLNQQSITNYKKAIDDLYKEYQKPNSNVKASTIMNDIYDMLDTAKELNTFGDKEFDHYKGMLVNLSKNIKDYGRPVSIYEDMAKVSPEQLKEYIDKLEDFAKTFREGENAQKLYPDLQLPKGIEYWKQKDASDWAYKEATTAKEILKTYHMNRDANFTWEKGRKDKDKETQDMDAALKKLDEFYKRREEMMTVALNKGELTEEEYNRRIMANEKEHLEERQNLRKKFMDVSQAFDHDYITDLMKDVNFDKINKYVKEKGDKVTDDLRLQIAKDAVKIQTDIKNAQDAVNKVLFGENNFKKLTETLTKDIDLLELLLPGIKTDGNGNYDSKRLESQIARRTEFLMSHVKDGMTMTKEQLSKELSGWNLAGEALNGAGFDGWDAWSLDDKQIGQLLERFKKFSIEYNKELRKDANEIKRQIDEENAENGFDSKYTEKEKRMEKEMGVLNQFYSNYNMSPLLNKSDADNMELAMYDLKIQKIREYMDMEKAKFALLIENAKTDEERTLRQRQLDYLLEESKEELTEVMSEQTQKQGEIALRTIEQMRPYADMVNQFAEDFGKNLFGKVEDRKAAAKALLVQFTKTTMALLTQELNYLAISRMANKAAKAEEMADAATDAIQTNVMNTAKGVGHEVGNKGILGFATSAAITAGMTLLTAIITSALNKGKSELGVSTGKLSTGMLTYANGRYPTYGNGTMEVQGNDGKTYNATVKPNLTTGEYAKPHLGIVGENGAELIVDHKTYTGLKTQAPQVLQVIYDMHKYGRLRLNYGKVMSQNEYVTSMMLDAPRRGVRTYASGNIDEVIGAADAANVYSNDGRLTEALERNNAIMERMLVEGVQSKIVMLGDDGLYKNMQRAGRFMKGKE